ncbi:hypothetical protein OROHE_003592 [Orobanche hederae]
MGVVLDPRRKRQYIEWVVGENFKKEKATSFLSNLDNNMRALFELYSSSTPTKEKNEVSSCSSTSSASPMWGHEV